MPFVQEGRFLGYDSARLDRINYNPRVIFEFYTISNLFEIQWENLDRMFRWLLEASPWNSNVRWKNRLWYLLKNNLLWENFTVIIALYVINDTVIIGKNLSLSRGEGFLISIKHSGMELRHVYERYR